MNLLELRCRLTLIFLLVWMLRLRPAASLQSFFPLRLRTQETRQTLRGQLIVTAWLPRASWILIDVLHQLGQLDIGIDQIKSLLSLFPGLRTQEGSLIQGR